MKNHHTGHYSLKHYMKIIFEELPDTSIKNQALIFLHSVTRKQDDQVIFMIFHQHYTLQIIQWSQHLN